MAFKLTGSVFPTTLPVVLPSCLLAVLLKVLHNEGILEDVTKMTFLQDFSSWGGFSGLVNFVIVFRLSQAYTTYWAAFTSTSQMLGDWSGAASSVVVFCRNSKADSASIEAFLQTVVRLFSMLSACALQELSPRTSHKIWGLLTLNSVSIDSKSIATLDGSADRLGLVYHWIQQLLVDNQASGMLAAPAPIVGRAFAELGSGMGKFVDAKKHATEQFNFPYAQTTKWLLILYSALMPLMMVQWSDWVVGAFLFTFVQLFFTWSLNEITVILESPFDTSNQNCIDLFVLQRQMNQALLLLMHPMTRNGPPKLEKYHTAHDDVSKPFQKQWYSDYSELEKRDTIHQASLRKEGWQLKSELVLSPSSPSGHYIDLEEGHAARCKCCHCLRCCCSSSKVVPREISVSGYYSSKRFGIVDGEKTAVLPIGIFGDHLLIAVPPACTRLRRRCPLVDVQSSGYTSQVVVKSILITDRHKLYRRQFVKWDDADCKDFRYEHRDLVNDIFYARSKFLSIPVSKVSIQADLAVDEQIESAKAVDKGKLGIEKLVNLKSYELFCKQLKEHCGFDQQAAQDEWNRRRDLPDKYEQGRDNRGCVIIELDIEEFKDEWAKEQTEKERNEKLLKEARQGIEAAKSSGKINQLSTCIKNAEKDAVGLSKGELDEAQQVLLNWSRIDGALSQAAQDKDFQELDKAINLAVEAHLQSEGFTLAQKVMNEVRREKTERLQQEIESAKAAGKIKVLEACIQDVEKDAVGLSDIMKELDDARNLLLTWHSIDLALSQAIQQRDLTELEQVLRSAKEAKLSNANYIKAEGVWNELQLEIAMRNEIDTAKCSGRIADLEACLEKAEALSEAEFDDVKKLLLKWHRVDVQLCQAAEQRNMTELNMAIASAQEAKLHNDTYLLAEKVLDELKNEVAQKESEQAQEVLDMEPKQESKSDSAALDVNAEALASMTQVTEGELRAEQLAEVGKTPESKAESASPQDTARTEERLPSLPGVVKSEAADSASSLS